MTNRVVPMWLCAVLSIGAPLAAQTAAPSPAAPAGPSARPPRRAFDLTTPRPIPARDSVWIEELTWMEVRDAFEPGGTSATPGTLQIGPETYEALVTDEAESLEANGFAHVVLIGDSGGNQRGLEAVAKKLSAASSGSGTTIHFIPEYYASWEAADGAWTSLGVPKTRDDGIHDDYSVNAIIATVDPGKIRFEERRGVGQASINGQTLLPLETTVANGKKLVEIRATLAVAAIRKALQTP